MRHLLVVAVTNRRIGRKELVELRHVRRRKDDLDRRGVAFEIRAPFRPWDRNDVIALRENPGEGNLRRGGGLFLGKGLEPFDQRAVRVKVVALEARQPPA